MGLQHNLHNKIYKYAYCAVVFILFAYIYQFGHRLYKINFDPTKLIANIKLASHGTSSYTEEDTKTCLFLLQFDKEGAFR